MKALLPLILIGLCAQSHARTELVLGKEQGVRAAFCMVQADAEAIAQADHDGGIPQARAAMAARDCAAGAAYVYAKRITYSAKTDRGSTVRVIEVEMELDDDSKQTLFMVVDVEIAGLVET